MVYIVALSPTGPQWKNNAGKKLYILELRVLRRSGVSVTDLTTVYFTLIKSVLEYGCLLWNCFLSASLSDKLEFIQKLGSKYHPSPMFLDIISRDAIIASRVTLAFFLVANDCVLKIFFLCQFGKYPLYVPILDPPQCRDTNTRLTSLRYNYYSFRFTLSIALTERFKRSLKTVS